MSKAVCHALQLRSKYICALNNHVNILLNIKSFPAVSRTHVFLVSLLQFLSFCLSNMETLKNYHEHFFRPSPRLTLISFPFVCEDLWVSCAVVLNYSSVHGHQHILMLILNPLWNCLNGKFHTLLIYFCMCIIMLCHATFLNFLKCTKLVCHSISQSNNKQIRGVHPVLFITSLHGL